MSIKSIVFAFIAFFAISTSAFAAVQDFGDLSVDVPAGWAAVKTGSTVAITAVDNSAALTITLEENDGTAMEAIADAFLAQLNGVDPELDEDGTFTFSFVNANGIECNVVLTGDEDFYFMLILMGEHDDMEAIIDSIEIN